MRASAAVGRVLAERFELRQLLGVGAFGEVYQAQDRQSPNTPLAIKMLRHPGAQALYRFKREFRALGELAHPNLVGLHELFLDEQSAFFTMELVSGVDFLSYVRPGGALSPERLLPTLQGLCEGVSALHARGRLHRDLKPSNVLVEQGGRVVIVDFGLATMLERGDAGASELGFMGTAHYAAPEQLALGKVGPGSDWYAVGTMLYEALSGALPYDEPFFRLSEAKSRPPPALPAQPGELAQLAELCVRMLQPDLPQRAGGAQLRACLGLSEPPPSAAREAPFLGRSAQLQALEELFARVERGAAAVALVLAPSGLGKTALVEHFLDDLRRSHRATVLRSRCYVNEELAYQAVDGSIDALSHYLCSLPRAQTAALLPRDVRSLACVFPVLNRVESIAAAPAVRSALEDRASLRERAAGALRELVARLSDRLPLVLFIDDIQWDDEDSAWLLSALCGDPDPPALLLIATCRSDARAQSHLLRALEQNQASARLAVQELVLPALSVDETVALALHAAGDPAQDRGVATRIAEESGGHPLFALELARWTHARGAGEEREPSLEAAIRSRARDASEPAQRLLEVVCVAGHPLKGSVAACAAGSEATALRELVACKLVSSSGSGADDAIEAYHDRVREALLAALSAERVQEHHAALAAALEQDAQPRFDLIVEHYLAAGQPARAASHALRAADHAASVLAFHRVPELLTLAVTAASAAERGLLYVRLADAYALVGRTVDAARAYQDAADLEPDPEQRWELGSMAMWQALQAQDFELGFALLRQLDAPFGLRGVSPTWWRALPTMLRYLSWQLFGPPRLRPAAAPGARLSDRRRLRLAFRASTGIIGAHGWQALHLMVATFRLAAELGDAVVYAGLLSMFAAGTGLLSGRASAGSERLLEQARTLADEQADAGTRIWVGAMRTAYAQATAQYGRAVQELTGFVDAPFPTTLFGAFLRSFVDTMSVSVLFWSGSIARACGFATRVIGRTRGLSDRHLELGVRALTAFRLLALDDAEGAWREWSLAREHYPEHFALREPQWGIVPALYAARFDRAESAMLQSRRLLFTWDAYLAPGRSMYLWWWGALAAARLSAGESSGRLRLRLRLASWLLSFRTLPMFEPFAASLRAARAFLAGRPEQGVHQLRLAQTGFAARELSMLAACASHALAALDPDQSARAAHAASAREVFEREHIKSPDAWTRALLPGLPASG